MKKERVERIYTRKVKIEKASVYFAAVPFVIVATLLNTPVIPLG